MSRPGEKELQILGVLAAWDFREFVTLSIANWFVQAIEVASRAAIQVGEISADAPYLAASFE
jgi:hypothetical protein